MMYYNSYFLDTRYVIFQKGPFYPSCNKNDSIPNTGMGSCEFMKQLKHNSVQMANEPQLESWQN